MKDSPVLGGQLPLEVSLVRLGQHIWVLTPAAPPRKPSARVVEQLPSSEDLKLNLERLLLYIT